MQTRLATIDDQTAVAALLAEMRGHSTETSALKQLAYFQSSDDRAIILATDDQDVPVGMAAVNLVYKLPKIECRIDEVIVSASVRGQGYGKTLMAACEAWAWEHKTNVIELTSRPSREAANGLYQAIGFSLRETNVYTKKQAKE